MLKKTGVLLLEQGFKIMVSGFVVLSAGAILFVKSQNKNPTLEKIALGIAAFGVALWLSGRVCVIIQRHRARRVREQEAGEASGSET